MKYRSLEILAIMVLMLNALIVPTCTYAQSNNEAFQQAVTEYQKSPSVDGADKVIKLAVAMDKLPVVPEEARKHFVKGAALFKEAKSPADFTQVLDEFKEAARLAPWWPEARYNFALACESAGEYPSAMANLKLYQLFKLSDNDARSVQDKIYALEAKQEKAAKETSPEAVAAKKQDEGESWLKSLDGARFIGPPQPSPTENATMYLVYYIEGNKVHAGWFDREPADFKTASIRGIEFMDGSRSVWSLDIQGKQFFIPQPSFQDFRYDTATISDDGQFITFDHAKSVMKRVK